MIKNLESLIKEDVIIAGRDIAILARLLLNHQDSIHLIPYVTDSLNSLDLLGVGSRLITEHKKNIIKTKPKKGSKEDPSKEHVDRLIYDTEHYFVKLASLTSSTTRLLKHYTCGNPEVKNKCLIEELDRNYPDLLKIVEDYQDRFKEVNGLRINSAHNSSTREKLKIKGHHKKKDIKFDLDLRICLAAFNEDISSTTEEGLSRLLKAIKKYEPSDYKTYSKKKLFSYRDVESLCTGNAPTFMINSSASTSKYPIYTHSLFGYDVKLDTRDSEDIKIVMSMPDKEISLIDYLSLVTKESLGYVSRVHQELYKLISSKKEA